MSELGLNNNQKDQNIYNFLWKTIKTRKFLLILLLLIMIIHDTAGVFLAQYFNRLLISGARNINIPFYLCLTYLLMYAFFQNMHYLDKSIMYKIIFNSIAKIKNNLRNNLYSYVIQHSMDYFNNSFSGSLNNKINSIVKDAGKTIELALDFISTIVLAIIAPILYSNINIYIGLSFTIISILYILALTKLRKFRKEKSKQIAESKNKYFGLINDDFTNILNIKIFSHEKIEINNVRRINNQILRNAYEFLKTVFIFAIVNFVFCFIFIFSILGISAYMLAQNKINISDFMFVAIITSIFRFVIENSSKKLTIFSDATARLENNLKELIKPIEIKNKPNSKNINITNGKIVFKNINFSYEKGGENAK